MGLGVKGVEVSVVRGEASSNSSVEGIEGYCVKSGLLLVKRGYALIQGGYAPKTVGFIVGGKGSRINQETDQEIIQNLRDPKLSAKSRMERSTERRLEALEVTMEGMKAESAAVRRELHQLMRMVGAQNSLNDIPRRHDEGIGGRVSGEHQGIQKNGRKKVALPTFKGLDPFSWINRAEKFFDMQRVMAEEEKIELASLSMEGSAGYWFKAWKEKAKNRSWDGLKGALVIRFGTYVERKSFWERTCGEVSRSEVDRYNPGRSKVTEWSVRSEQERTVGPNGSGVTKPNDTRRSESNDKALQAANPRGLKELNGSEANGREPPTPNVKGREEPNGLTCKQSRSNWQNGLTIRMKAKEGKVDGRINGRERRMDFAPAEGIELFEALKDIEDHFFGDYNSGKEVTRMLEANKIQKEWKSLEEELLPPKPPDLNWRAVTKGFHSYEYTMMRRSHEIKPSISNLEDKMGLGVKGVEVSVVREEESSNSSVEGIEGYYVKSGLLLVERAYALIQGGYAPRMEGRKSPQKIIVKLPHDNPPEVDVSTLPNL
ncbi:hypothetical protein V8G54_030492 [Vigna mungo]|uniref:Retrotransposon gag domain-containing protein n=1 Tax=Vigna mungo TaxID=3915 RepID=A0AAQ3MWE3_VIGMU